MILNSAQLAVATIFTACMIGSVLLVFWGSKDVKKPKK